MTLEIKRLRDIFPLIKYAYNCLDTRIPYTKAFLQENMKKSKQYVVDRFNHFMDRLNKDTKIGQFLEILLSKEEKLKDISKETINFDDVLRKIGMNPNDYQVKSKFLGIFDEVKEYNEYLQSIQGSSL